MDDHELLDYLAKYVANPSIISLGDLPEENQRNLPHSWVEILSESGDARIEKSLAHWRPYAAIFEQVIEYLEANLEQIDLVHHGFGHALVYQVRSASGKSTLCYEARNPKTKTVDPTIEASWDLLPSEWRKFYDEFHNGWYYLASGSMGPSAVEEFFFLDDLEWGILETIDKPAVDLTRTLALWANGMGAYVCLELETDPQKALVWWDSKAPTLDLDLNAVVDSWTAMGFDA